MSRAGWRSDNKNGPKARKGDRPPEGVAPKGPGPRRKAKRADARAGA
jgi:hypothetical protein